MAPPRRAAARGKTSFEYVDAAAHTNSEFRCRATSAIVRASGSAIGCSKPGESTTTTGANRAASAKRPRLDGPTRATPLRHPSPRQRNWRSPGMKGSPRGACGHHVRQQLKCAWRRPVTLRVELQFRLHRDSLDQFVHRTDPFAAPLRVGRMIIQHFHCAARKARRAPRRRVSPAASSWLS